MIVNTGLLTADAKSLFLNELSVAEQGLIYALLSTRIQSSKDSEKYRWLGTVPQMREWGTGRLAKGLRSESYDVENLKYEATLEVSRDELADDQTNQIRVRIQELARRAATHKDKLIASLLDSGATAGFNSYDGVTFFNASHVSGASGTQSNALTFDVATPASPTSAEMKAAIGQAIQQMATFKDDQGEPMMIGMGGLMTIVPPNMYQAAREALNASMIANTSNTLSGQADLRVFPFLSGTTKFYVCKTDGIVRPFIFQDREPLEFNAQAENSETEFQREVYLYGVRARYRMTYGYWQYAVQTTLN